MPAFICQTCGSQFTPSQAPPPCCPICQDQRQYVPPGGQKWTTLDELAPRHFNCYQQHEPGLIGVGTVPEFAIAQPHYYSSMVEWSRAFGGIPIHLHAADRQWIMRSDPAIKLWEGDTLPIAQGITLIRCGGHFAGGTVLHWAARGAVRC